MKHTERRRELGKMLMDVAKYLATVGLIGELLTNKLTTSVGFFTTMVVLMLVVLAFYVIPPKK
jgi:uncharacterized membrane protein